MNEHDDCDHHDSASPESERDAYLEHLDAEARGPRYARRARAPEPFDSAQRHLRPHLTRLEALMRAAEPAEQLADDPKRELDEDARRARAGERPRGAPRRARRSRVTQRPRPQAGDPCCRKHPDPASCLPTSPAID